MALKKKFFQNPPSGWVLLPQACNASSVGGLPHRPPFVTRLSYTSLLNTSPNLDIIAFNFGKSEAAFNLPLYNIFVPKKFLS